MIQPARGHTRYDAKLYEVLEWLGTIDPESMFPRDARVLREIGTKCRELADAWEHTISYVRQAQRDEAQRIRTREIQRPTDWDDALMPDDARTRDAYGRFK